MARHELTAVFESGVFRPLEPDRLQLTEGDQVKIVLETEKRHPTMTPDAILTLAAGVYTGLSEEEIDEIERIAFDRSRFFDGRGLNELS